MACERGAALLEDPTAEDSMLLAEADDILLELDFALELSDELLEREDALRLDLNEDDRFFFVSQGWRSNVERRLAPNDGAAHDSRWIICVLERIRPCPCFAETRYAYVPV